MMMMRVQIGIDHDSKICQIRLIVIEYETNHEGADWTEHENREPIMVAIVQMASTINHEGADQINYDGEDTDGINRNDQNID